MARISSASTSAGASARDRASASARDRVSASARHRALPYHCISQSFNLPPATTSVSHLTCPLPRHQSVIWLALYHYITTLVSHLTCPHHHISQSFDLPPATNQAVIWLAHCHHIIMSPPPLALALVLALALALALALDIECYHITASVNHLTCPLPPHQSVIWLAHCHHITSQS